MYAVIETGGKQYQVREGDEVFIEKLDIDTDAAVTFDKVIVVGKDDGITVGKPYVDGATVAAVVVKNGKAKKINIFTYKSKEGSTYRRQGHRQPYTKVRIESIKA
jgi:large subunit ribosomal protein L21